MKSSPFMGRIFISLILKWINMEERLLNYFNGDELAASVWKNKYANENESTPEDMFKRISKEFARIENNYPEPLTEEQIYDCLDKFKYIIPGGSVLASCGTGKLASLSNCFVIAGPRDSYSSIPYLPDQRGVT